MEEAGIYARAAPSLDCHVQLGAASGKLLSVSFPDQPDEGATAEHPLLDRIEAYLNGAEESFADVDVALTLPTDRRGVLETLRSVDYGESVTVAVLARTTPGLADTDEDHRLVREALADNPTPLVIPDHRVRDGPSAAPPPVEQRLRTLEGL
ncbi:MGMT family protein [Halosegnis sp.]|uniref:MGMT family protein n=1 Tax=Halosegnis sp. TaxID=2864959 RepID=UPI0035D3EED3